ncbi:MAG: hypothetical protein FJW39_25725 [Acidobacteria bacterium]|nr:hypothetical protein [Acidobacteriota bacterium]
MKLKTLAFTLAALTIPGLHNVHAQGQDQPTMTGTWIAAIRINENLPPGVPATFRALHTYIADGRFLDRNTQNPAGTSSGHGEWEPIGNRRFALTFIFFSFDPTGQHAATIKVRSTITLNERGDEWTGPLSAQAFSPEGAPLGPPALGVHTGLRVVSEPLPQQ